MRKVFFYFLAFLLVLPTVSLAATIYQWNGYDLVGLGPVVYKWNGINFGTSAGNIVGWNGLGGKTAQTITWNTQPSAMTVGDADQTLNQATASSSLTVTYTTDTTAYCTVVAGPKLHAVAAGSCVVHADQAGNGTYYPAPRVDSGNVTISAGGGSSYYYASGKSDTSFTSDDGAGDTGYLLGSAVTVSSGTYTKVGVKVNSHTDDTFIQACIYDMGGNLVVDGGILSLNGGTTPYWLDFTISSALNGTYAVLWHSGIRRFNVRYV